VNKKRKMGFRYYRRMNLGNGLGLNFSKSGVSSSIRTKFGTFGSKGFSIRTGIPGLSYRKTFSRSKQQDGALIFLLALLALALIYFSIVIVWNLGRFLVWSIARINHMLKTRKTKQVEASPIDNTIISASLPDKQNSIS